MFYMMAILESVAWACKKLCVVVWIRWQELGTTLHTMSDWSKVTRSPKITPMGHPWSRVHIDYVDPIRNHYLLVVIDSFSKRLDVAVVPSANSTNTIQILIHGLPQVLVSNNGALFVSAEFCSRTEFVTLQPHHTILNPTDKWRELSKQ